MLLWIFRTILFIDNEFYLCVHLFEMGWKDSRELHKKHSQLWTSRKPFKLVSYRGNTCMMDDWYHTIQKLWTQLSHINIYNKIDKNWNIFSDMYVSYENHPMHILEHSGMVLVKQLTKHLSHIYDLSSVK